MDAAYTICLLQSAANCAAEIWLHATHVSYRYVETMHQDWLLKYMYKYYKYYILQFSKQHNVNVK